MKAITRAETGAAKILQLFLFSGFATVGPHCATALAQDPDTLVTPEVEVLGHTIWASAARSDSSELLRYPSSHCSISRSSWQFPMTHENRIMSIRS